MTTQHKTAWTSQAQHDEVNAVHAMLNANGSGQHVTKLVETVDCSSMHLAGSAEPV